MPQPLSAEKKQTKEDLAQELISMGYAKEAIFSPKDSIPTEEDIKKIPESIRPFVERMVSFYKSPLLIDGIDERVTNHEREVIFALLQEQDPELAALYKEGNKLHASSVVQPPFLMRTLNRMYPLPADILEKVEKIRKEINGTDTESFSPLRYKAELSTPEKISITKEVDSLVLDVVAALSKENV